MSNCGSVPAKERSVGGVLATVEAEHWLSSLGGILQARWVDLAFGRLKASGYHLV